MLTYSEINVGDAAEFSKTISEFDVYQFAGLSGDFNPVHVNKEFAKDSLFNERIAHGMLVGSFISTILGTKLPGENTIYLSQNLKFVAPVKIGDTVTAKVEVTEKRDDRQIIKLKTQVLNQHGKIVIDGEAAVMKR
jgi:3-hydroxybutyryl-CoA dehydratase